ncbi:unnamed protein product, partial [marine sediment metagenome]
ESTISSTQHKVDTLQLCMEIDDKIKSDMEYTYSTKLNMDKNYFIIIIQLSSIFKDTIYNSKSTYNPIGTPIKGNENIDSSSAYSLINKLLSSGRIVKVGCAIDNDMHGLSEDYGFTCKTVIDTQNIAKSCNIDILSLENNYTFVKGRMELYVNYEELRDAGIPNWYLRSDVEDTLKKIATKLGLYISNYGFSFIISNKPYT